MTREKMWEEFETGIIDVIERWKKRLEQEPFNIDTYCEEHFCFIVDKDVWEKAEKALEQEPKTGHWIYWHTNGFGRKIYKCSKCNWDDDTAGYNYCPNCGAKMESEE